MKLLLIVSAFIFAGSLQAEECSKEKAKKEVQRVCGLISKDGKKPKTKDLIFQNCGKNYIWIQDTDEAISMVSHPIKRRLNGASLKDRKDENGFQLFFEFDKEAHSVAGKSKTKSGRSIASANNGGWVEYFWAKPGAEKATKKVSYVELCEGPGGVAWIAGSGIWTEDLK